MAIDNSRMSPKVTTKLNKDWVIEQQYVGVQNAKTVEAGISKILEFVKEVNLYNRPVLLLIDLKKLETSSLGARLAAIQGMRKIKYKRAGLYGPFQAQVLINTLALVSEVGRRLKIFDTRSEAMKWLTEVTKENEQRNRATLQQRSA